ncbi:MAG: PhoH family protein [Alphaproteobacteria bacterium]|nr:PhoH family protein [Alphaproteobacteria bacterium]
MYLEISDNSVLPILFGEHDRNIARIEQLLGVSIRSRGGQIEIRGPGDSPQTAKVALERLYRAIRKGQPIDQGEVESAVRMAEVPDDTSNDDGLAIRTRLKTIKPRSPTQVGYIRALKTHELVFGLGPAGTGKTYIAVAQAVALLTSGKVTRIILSRPAVEAGERLGFLPGDMREKIDPYLRPLYDALYDMLPAELVAKHLTTGTIEIAPLAFMRGRTLANSYIILDEAQNTTPTQMKMFLTRLGENSRMAITGDLSQIDLPMGAKSGLRDAADTLAGVDGVAFVRFTDADVVRHPLVTRIVRAYNALDARLTPPPAE